MQEKKTGDLKIRKITAEDDKDMARLIRENLEKHALNIPGTAYFDECVDCLSGYYLSREKGNYYVLTNEDGEVLGGVGFDEISFIEGCAEVQKLYLADSVKGRGLGYKLMEFVEAQICQAGFERAYLETHKNLKTAIHLYEKIGYKAIERPKAVAHGAMDHFYLKELI